ncbi:hypothetical protein L208DRAFT_119289 [Tricholoma matsutake]|nr:hypothetical protein L208DRAFT_119289 [Tricholoma matsutake 945]
MTSPTSRCTILAARWMPMEILSSRLGHRIGAGKTALLVNGLCCHWGFYFVAERSGARDRHNVGVFRWIQDAFKNPMSSDIQPANFDNQMITFKMGIQSAVNAVDHILPFRRSGKGTECRETTSRHQTSLAPISATP